PHPYSYLFFVSPAPPQSAIYTLSLHDALPIFRFGSLTRRWPPVPPPDVWSIPAARAATSRSTTTPITEGQGRPLRRRDASPAHEDRKSTRLNSSHEWISYAVFCLKKKTQR